MKLQTVNSSAVEAMGWEKETLYIQYRGGRVYSYAEVPKHVYDSIKNAESIGKFVNKHIKGAFTAQSL